VCVCVGGGVPEEVGEGGSHSRCARERVCVLCYAWSVASGKKGKQCRTLWLACALQGKLSLANILQPAATYRVCFRSLLTPMRLVSMLLLRKVMLTSAPDCCCCCCCCCCWCYQELADVTEADERAAAEKRVKSRTLGTVRLIAELFRKDVVTEAIILVCIRELLEVTGRLRTGGRAVSRSYGGWRPHSREWHGVVATTLCSSTEECPSKRGGPVDEFLRKDVCDGCCHRRVNTRAAGAARGGGGGCLRPWPSWCSGG
jgi:hypothetical protein